MSQELALSHSLVAYLGERVQDAKSESEVQTLAHK